MPDDKQYGLRSHLPVTIAIRLKANCPCEAALSSPDEGRDAVPIARDDERALPDAWRRVARRAEGE